MKNKQNTRRGFTQNVSYTGENGLFSSPLEGEDVRRTDEGGTKPNQYILHSEKNVSFTPHPAFGRPLPQGARGATRGFTLIELLVVVLIIGILAAVAVPQYKVAVAKSRVATMLPLLKSIAEAQEVYYLSNEQYAKLDDLDVNIPTECSPLEESGSIEKFKCGNFFVLGTNYGTGHVFFDYCPNENISNAQCEAKRDLHVTFRLNHFTDPARQAGKRYCVVYNSSSLGRTVCSNFAFDEYDY